MRKSGMYVAAGLMLAATLAFGEWAQHRPVESLSRPLKEIPATLGQWHATGDQQLSDSIKEKLNSSSYLSRTYSNGHRTLDLFIAYYAAQRAGESMHSPKHCLPGAGWDISHHEELPVTFAGNTFTINRYDIQRNTEHEVTLYWYQSRDRILANEYKAKVMLAYDSMVKGRTAGSIVRIISQNDDSAKLDAEDLARQVIPEMHRCLNPRE